MRKIFSCFGIIFLSTSISLVAQNQTLSEEVHKNMEAGNSMEGIGTHEVPVLYKTMNTAAGPTERWYNYGSAMDIIVAQSIDPKGSVLNANTLFPDTSIIVKYGKPGGPYTYSGPWIHSIGDVLDVTSDVFNEPSIFANELLLSKASSFRLDSIFFYCRYNRNTSDTIVDTLVFEIAASPDLKDNGFVGSSINTFLGVGSDTVWFKQIPYSYANNSLNISSKQVYKIPLTSLTYADSLNSGIHIIKFATTNLADVVPGGYIVSSVHFIPGYTWLANIDSLVDKNSIRFFSYKEQADGPPVYINGDYNVSYIIPSVVRYNLDTVSGGWNGDFIPSYAYMGNSSSQYNYEHHLIYYKVSCLSGCGTVSTNDIEADNFTNGIKLFQNQPNPSNSSTFIFYELGKNSSSVVLSVYDITGKRILVIDEGRKLAGKYSIKINRDRLKSGVYFYTLIGDSGNSLTRKMIISE